MNTSDIDPTVPGVPPSQTGAGDQGSFVIGIGGPCTGDVLPAYGYSCSPGGGPRGAGQHMHPSGLAALDNLPHAPYHNATGAVIHAWRPAHWFTVQPAPFHTCETLDHTRAHCPSYARGLRVLLAFALRIITSSWQTLVAANQFLTRASRHI
jgi:hypothetical protein